MTKTSFWGCYRNAVAAGGKRRATHGSASRTAMLWPIKIVTESMLIKEQSSFGSESLVQQLLDTESCRCHIHRSAATRCDDGRQCLRRDGY